MNSRSMQRAIYHQPYCDTCHLTTLDFSGDARIMLTPWVECKMAFWCSQNCRNLSYPKHRQELCEDLSEHVAFKRMLYTGIILDLGAQRLANSSISLPTAYPRSTSVQLSCLGSWRDYFQLSKVPTASCISTTNSVTSFDSETVTHYRHLKNTSNEMTCVLTILAGLEATITNLDTKSALTIHPVGAAGWEPSKVMLTEELFHLRPRLKHLTVGYVGPEMSRIPPSLGVSSPASKYLRNLDSCKECQSSGRSNRIFAYRGPYHEFLTTDLATHHPPDLIVAFTSGHQDTNVDLWAPTLKKSSHLISQQSSQPSTYKRPAKKKQLSKSWAQASSYDRRSTHGMVWSRTMSALGLSTNYGTKIFTGTLSKGINQLLCLPHRSHVTDTQ